MTTLRIFVATSGASESAADTADAAADVMTSKNGKGPTVAYTLHESRTEKLS